MCAEYIVCSVYASLFAKRVTALSVSRSLSKSNRVLLLYTSVVLAYATNHPEARLKRPLFHRLWAQAMAIALEKRRRKCYHKADVSTRCKEA